MEKQHKRGTVALVGRPNVGKSTLLNALVGQKVSIVTDKPQTTRSEITAFYEDDRGQIFFTDTPGYYQGKKVSSSPTLIKKVVHDSDVVMYVVDQTRDWGEEDERLWRMVEDSGKKVVLVINKLDVTSHDFASTYEILIGKHAEAVIRASALQEKHLQAILSTLFNLLPAGERDTTVDYFPSPLISQTGEEYLAEIIREKVFERCGEEVPYQVRTKVTDIDENEETNTLKIKGLLIVPNSRYKPILIGANGQMVRDIRMATEKELRVATNKSVTVRLQVATESEIDEY